MVLDEKSSQEYSVNARVLQGSIPDPTLFRQYINELSDDIICFSLLLSLLLLLLISFTLAIL